MAEQHQPWIVEVEKALLGQNARFAEQNRALFQRAGLLVLNLVSSPGSGKTALLERTLSELSGQLRLAVQVGDLRTDNDARRLHGRGAPVVQIVTGGVCHLEASMVARALEKFDLGQLDVLIIENVGNLVCTASYDLGEDRRVVLFSVTEGEDKPLKYPTIFRNADLVLITKMDIAQAVGANLEEMHRNIERAAPRARILELSARTGIGMQAWYDYLLNARREHLVNLPVGSSTK
jgi:hydrogenase nickel incorporation protein HypB